MPRTFYTHLVETIIIPALENYIAYNQSSCDSAWTISIGPLKYDKEVAKAKREEHAKPLLANIRKCLREHLEQSNTVEAEESGSGADADEDADAELASHADDKTDAALMRKIKDLIDKAGLSYGEYKRLKKPKEGSFDKLLVNLPLLLGLYHDELTTAGLVDQPFSRLETEYTAQGLFALALYIINDQAETHLPKESWPKYLKELAVEYWRDADLIEKKMLLVRGAYVKLNQDLAKLDESDAERLGTKEATSVLGVTASVLVADARETAQKPVTYSWKPLGRYGPELGYDYGRKVGRLSHGLQKLHQVLLKVAPVRSRQQVKAAV